MDLGRLGNMLTDSLVLMGSAKCKHTSFLARFLFELNCNFFFKDIHFALVLSGFLLMCINYTVDDQICRNIIIYSIFPLKMSGGDSKDVRIHAGTPQGT